MATDRDTTEIGASGGGQTTTPLASVIELERCLLRDDVARIERGLGETRQALNCVSARLARFEAAMRMLKAEKDELSAKEQVEMRMLVRRRRTLLDLEAEAI